MRISDWSSGVCSSDLDLLDHLGLQDDSGRGGIERARPQILQSRRAGADEHDMIRDPSLDGGVVTDTPCRYRTVRHRPRVVAPDAARGAGRDDADADAYFADSGRFPATPHTPCPR